MNEKFYHLSREKQMRIINAGYRVFSQNSYKKSPMSEIADAAGISKSLLFHYFVNKRELYLFLWEKCVESTIKSLTDSGCFEKKDLFEMMYCGINAKMHILRQYPDMGRFMAKAFYEKDPAVCQDIQKSYQRILDFCEDSTIFRLDEEQFAPGLDLQMMYREMNWAAEGYLWEMMQWDELDFDQLEEDSMRLINFWKSVYQRKEV